MKNKSKAIPAGTPAQRRKFLAAQKVEPAEPLDSSERAELFDLIDAAYQSNHRLLANSRELEETRTAFDLAKKNLEIAEADMANERAENQRIQTRMAPLFHRLTTPKA